jgi:hypothetical protein
VTSDEGMTFFTIRARTDNGGTHYMPGSRNRMPRRAGRALTCHTEAGGGSRDLIPMTEDGVASQIFALAKGASETPSWDGPKQERFYIVISGSLVQDGRTFGIHSCLHVPEGESEPKLTAGPEGAQILFLQFPARALLTA